MKNKRSHRIILLCVVLALIIFALVPRPDRGNRYLASLGISIPASAVTAYEKGPFMLTGDEHLIAFRLTQNQMPALIKQIQSKERFEFGSYPRDMAPQIIHSPYVTKFFAAVPKNATGANFLEIHRKGEASEWATSCSLAIDKATGRVWFYGQEIYN